MESHRRRPMTAVISSATAERHAEVLNRSAHCRRERHPIIIQGAWVSECPDGRWHARSHRPGSSASFPAPRWRTWSAPWEPRGSREGRQERPRDIRPRRQRTRRHFTRKSMALCAPQPGGPSARAKLCVHMNRPRHRRGAPKLAETPPALKSGIRNMVASATTSCHPS